MSTESSSTCPTKRDERPRPFADDWKHKNPSELTYAQKVLKKRNVLNPNSQEFDYPKPKGKVPVFYDWDQHLRIFPIVVIPVVARWAYMHFTGWSAHPAVVYMLTVVFNSFFVRSFFKRLREYSMTYGFLDGEVDRDAIPEGMTGKLYKEMLVGLLGRPLMVFCLAYDRHAIPSLSWWLPIQLGVFTIIADFVYYWAHRATHEIPSIWKYHKRHHTTKHPSAYLLGFADEPQEIFDAFGTPIIAYMMYPINFDALYIWSMYFVSIEIMGHAGLRMYYPAVLTSALLRPFQCDAVIEDHDLHHRHGWRNSYNYGKQSVLWDSLFGTRGDRLETRADNVDWNHRVR